MWCEGRQRALADFAIYVRAEHPVAARFCHLRRRILPLQHVHKPPVSPQILRCLRAPPPHARLLPDLSFCPCLGCINVCGLFIRRLNVNVAVFVKIQLRISVVSKRLRLCARVRPLPSTTQRILNHNPQNTASRCCQACRNRTSGECPCDFAGGISGGHTLFHPTPASTGRTCGPASSLSQRQRLIHHKLRANHR